VARGSGHSERSSGKQDSPSLSDSAQYGRKDILYVAAPAGPMGLSKMSSQRRAALLDLSCTGCGSNRLRFPREDEELVVCEECGLAAVSLGELKARYVEELSSEDKLEGPDDRAARRERHTLEVAASQAELKESIAETDRLVDESDEMLRRHRRECDEEEAGG
jgi:hypothetical protein